MTDLEARLETDVKAMEHVDISVFNLPALSTAIEHYSAEKNSIGEHLSAEEGLMDWNEAR